MHLRWTPGSIASSMYARLSMHEHFIRGSESQQTSLDAVVDICMFASFFRDGVQSMGFRRAVLA